MGIPKESDGKYEEAGKLGLRIRRDGCPSASPKTLEEAGKTTGPKGVHILVRWCYGNILLGAGIRPLCQTGRVSIFRPKAAL